MSYHRKDSAQIKDKVDIDQIRALIQKSQENMLQLKKFLTLTYEDIGFSVYELHSTFGMHQKLGQARAIILEMIKNLGEIREMLNLFGLNDANKKALIVCEKQWISLVENFSKKINTYRAALQEYSKPIDHSGYRREAFTSEQWQLYLEILRQANVFLKTYNNSVRRFNVEKHGNKIYWKDNVIENTVQKLNNLITAKKAEFEAESAKLQKEKLEAEEKQKKEESRKEKEKLEAETLKPEFNALMQRGSQLFEVYNKERKTSSSWFKKASRHHEINFIDETVKIIKQAKEIEPRFYDDKRRAIDYPDKILAYLGALQLVQWKLQNETRFYEKKSTLAKILNNEINACKQFLRKINTYSDLNVWPDNAINTQAFRMINCIRGHRIVGQPPLKNPLWKSNKDNNVVWCYNNNTISDSFKFDIDETRVGYAKGKTRKPGE